MVILGLKQGKESRNATEELLLITSSMMEQLITELNWPDTVWVFSWTLMQILKEILKPLEGMMVCCQEAEKPVAEGRTNI